MPYFTYNIWLIKYMENEIPECQAIHYAWLPAKLLYHIREQGMDDFDPDKAILLKMK